MLSRLFSITIVLFWVIMTTLLVRSELWPNRSSLRTVPVERVAKLMWFHNQPSDLVVWSESRRVGHLRLHPKLRESDNARVFECSGNIQIRLPGSPRQRISWDSVIEFDKNLALRGLLLGIGMREAALDRAEIRVDLAENVAHFRLLDVHGIEQSSSDYSLDEAGLKKILKQVDLDPALFDTLRDSSPGVPTVSAQESSMIVHRERMKTYLIEMRHGGQTLLEAHIDELGKILRVRTLFGYLLMPDDLMP